MCQLDRRTGAIAETPKAHAASTLNSNVTKVSARIAYWGANVSFIVLVLIHGVVDPADMDERHE
jgi:hypothetical protein